MCILLLFSRVAMLLSTRISCLGIPSPFKRGLLKELDLHFSTFRLEAKHPPSATAQFLFRAGLCFRVLQWRLLNTTSGAYFSEEEVLFHLEYHWGSIWANLTIFGIRPTIFHHLQHKPSPWLRYFQWASVVRVAVIVWRVKSSVLGSSFHLEDPLEEVCSAFSSSTAISIQFLSCSCYSVLRLQLRHFFHLHISANPSRIVLK